MMIFPPFITRPIRQLFTRRLAIFGLLVIALLVVRVPYYGKLLLDDAFITFRYATNLVDHGQFVFNPGENVLATTTPLYALLLTGAYALHIPVPLAASILNTIFEIGLLFILGLLIEKFTLPPRLSNLAYLVAGGLTLTNQAMTFASAGGMETPLFTVLSVATLFLVMRRQYVAGAVTGSLASLVRPDGILVLLVLGLIVIIHERRLPIRETIVSLITGLPWVVIAYKTYGGFIPQSVIAKDAIARIWPMTLSLKLDILLVHPLRLFIIVALPLAILGIVGAWRSQYRGKALPLLVFGALQLIYLVLPNNLGFEWYFVPLYIIFNLFVGLELAFILNGAAQRSVRYAVGITATVAVLVAMPYTAVGNYLLGRTQDAIWREGVLPAIAFLDKNAAAGVTVQSDSIGVLGYFSQYRVLDTMGLASPQVLPLIRSAANVDQLLGLVAQHFQPEYIVTSVQVAYPGYHKVIEFETPNVPFVVYQRDPDQSGGAQTAIF